MKRGKVLIVENELDLLDLMAFNLSRAGLVTEGALDGQEAMEKMEAFGPDLIVLDLMLPKIDGWEICRQIKKSRSGLPVMIVSAKAGPDEKVLGFEAGADEYLTKPFSVKELTSTVQRLLLEKETRAGAAS